MTEPQVRRYDVQARSTETFGRVLITARNHHVVVDGPVQNGCPGEAIGPAEMFLASVAACGVELVQVLARNEKLPIERIAVEVSGEYDPITPVHPDVTLFSRVRLSFAIDGPNRQQAEQLLERFKRR